MKKNSILTLGSFLTGALFMLILLGPRYIRVGRLIDQFEKEQEKKAKALSEAREYSDRRDAPR